jgi:hypothetical protein
MVRILNWVVCFFCISVTISGQTESQDTTATVYAEEDLYEDDPYFWSHTKEIGLNFTPLLSKFIPFNLGKTDAGLIGLKYKKYYSERAFLVNFGSNITSRASNDGSIFFILVLVWKEGDQSQKIKNLLTQAVMKFFSVLMAQMQVQRQHLLNPTVLNIILIKDYFCLPKAHYRLG